MVVWQLTDLSVSPPMRHAGSADRLKLQFAAQEEVTAAAAKAVRLDTLADVSNDVIESTSLEGNVLTVIVSSMKRSIGYELAVTFTGADGFRWTRTLVIICVS